MEVDVWMNLAMGVVCESVLSYCKNSVAIKLLGNKFDYHNEKHMRMLTEVDQARIFFSSENFQLYEGAFNIDGEYIMDMCNTLVAYDWKKLEGSRNKVTYTVNAGAKKICRILFGDNEYLHNMRIVKE